MKNKVVEEVFSDQDLVLYLRTEPSKRIGIEFEKIRVKLKYGGLPSTPVKSAVSKPSATSNKNIVVKCTVASETAKAYNLKVELNASRYGIAFPFKPTLYIWMPKSCCHKLTNEYYEVVKFMAMENLDKAFVSLKRKLISDYGFSSSDIYKMNELHLA